MLIGGVLRPPVGAEAGQRAQRRHRPVHFTADQVKGAGVREAKQRVLLPQVVDESRQRSQRNRQRNRPHHQRAVEQPAPDAASKNRIFIARNEKPALDPEVGSQAAAAAATGAGGEGTPLSQGEDRIQKLAPGVYVTTDAEKKKWEERQRKMTEGSGEGQLPSSPSKTTDEEEFEKFYSGVKRRMEESVDLSSMNKLDFADAAKNSLKGASTHAIGAAAGVYLLASLSFPGLVEAGSTAAAAAKHAAAYGAAHGFFGHSNPFKDQNFKINLLLILCFYLLKNNMMNAINSVPGELGKKDMLGREIRDIYKFLYNAYKTEKVKGDDFHIDFVKNISEELFKMINDYKRARPDQQGRGKKKNRKKTKRKQKKKTKRKQKKKTKRKQNKY